MNVNIDFYFLFFLFFEKLKLFFLKSVLDGGDLL